MKEYFVKEENSDPFCSDGFPSGAENHPLSKSMVDHSQKRVKAIGEGKVGDEITGDLLRSPISFFLSLIFLCFPFISLLAEYLIPTSCNSFYSVSS